MRDAELFRRGGVWGREGPGVRCSAPEGPYFTNVRGRSREGKYVGFGAEVLTRPDILSRLSRLSYAEVFYVLRGCRMPFVVRAFTDVFLDGPGSVRLECSPRPWTGPGEAPEGEPVLECTSLVVRGLGEIEGVFYLYTDPREGQDAITALWRPPERYASISLDPPHGEDLLKGFFIDRYWMYYVRAAGAVLYAYKMGLLSQPAPIAPPPN